MFEARNAAFSRVMRVVALDEERTDALDIVLRQRNDQKKKKETDEKAIGRAALIYLLGIVTGAATIAKLFQDSTFELPNVDPSTLFDKTKQWIKDLFTGKGKETVKNDSSATEAATTPVTVTPDAASAPTVEEAQPQYRIKTAKAGAAEQEAIRRASKKKGVDYALLYSVAGVESSFRKDIKAGTSSAVGLFQFTEPTWKYLTKKFDLDYTMQDRRDPQKSAEVAGMYLSSIMSTLKSALGRIPSYGETYMGYFLGPSGAVKFLKALAKNPLAVGAEIFPQYARSNPNVFYAGGVKSKPLTLSQILARQEGKIASYAQDADPQFNQTQRQSDSTVSPIEIKLSSKGEAGGTGIASAGASVPQAPQMGGGIRTNSSGVRPKQQSIPEVSVSSEARTPEVKKNAQTSSTQTAATQHIHIDDTKPSVSTALIRGRDNRIYAVNI